MKRIIILIMCVICMFCFKVINYADGKEIKLDCVKVFEYDEKDNLINEFAGNTYGNLVSRIVIEGDVIANGKDEEFIKYDIKNGNSKLLFNIDKAFQWDSWEINPDEKKAFIDVLCSKDNDEKGFVLDYTIMDVFEGGYNGKKEIYLIKDVQMYTGCYYKIFVNYYLRKKLGENSLGPIKMAKYEKKHIVEEYKIYIANEELKDEYIKRLERKPKINLGEKYKVDDKNYNDNKKIDSKDVHFGWDIGQFFVNGYTEKKDDNGQIVFLKNVGDKISFWFELKQNIECLNNDEHLKINYDEASDLEFEEKIKGKGTLLIKTYDYEKNKQPNIVYNDFLQAKTLTGANTEVNLFEEGDYEIALDYEIVNEDTILKDKTNYKIPLKFKIRNGNCMIFPFDEITGDELQDGAITKNGFHLDFAKSRYLEINVERKELIKRDDSYKMDTRFNKPAKDGDKYVDEGIYIFKVKNKYTGEQVTKTIYVGENEVYNTLSKSGYSIDEINKKINDGYIIENGKLIKSTED